MAMFQFNREILAEAVKLAEQYRLPVAIAVNLEMLKALKKLPKKEVGSIHQLSSLGGHWGTEVFVKEKQDESFKLFYDRKELIEYLKEE